MGFGGWIRCFTLGQQPRTDRRDDGARRYPKETWREGTSLIRNPRAIHPLPDEWLGAAMEENDVNGQHISAFADPFLPYYSFTEFFLNDPWGWAMQRMEREWRELLTKHYPFIERDDPNLVEW